MVTAYKLFRIRRDGSLGPLFIDRSLVVPPGKWLKAKAIHARGFKFRPGFHACAKPEAPHLVTTGRRWCRVQLKGVTKHVKPLAQGGLWYTARQMKLVDARGF